MMNFNTPLTDLDIKEAILNCLSAFMLRGASKIILNCKSDLVELNNEIKKFGITCYGSNNPIDCNYKNRDFLSINCYDKWALATEDLDAKIKDSSQLKLNIEYVLVIIKSPIIIRVFINIFYIVLARAFAREHSKIFVSYNTLYKMNMVDRFNLMPTRKLKEPWIRTIKNCIKRAVQFIHLIKEPLVIIFEINHE